MIAVNQIRTGIETGTEVGGSVSTSAPFDEIGTGNSYLLAVIELEQTVSGTGSVTSVSTSSTEAFTLLFAYNRVGAKNRVEVWGRVVNRVGAPVGTVIAILSGSTESRKMAVYHMSGVSPVNPIDTTNVLEGTGSPIDLGITTTANDTMVFDIVATSSNDALTPASGQFIGLNDSSGSYSAASAYKPASTPGAQSVSWTHGGGGGVSWVHGLVALRPSGDYGGLHQLKTKLLRPAPFSPGLAR